MNKNMIDNNIVKFLRESNNIEDVWDDTSLAQALYAWNYIIGEDKLSVGNILKTHKILMLYHNLRPDEKGYFRQRPVWIGGREGEDWTIIPRLIEEWVIQANSILKMKLLNRKKYAKSCHIAYEHIHPFIDGNGRTGRLFFLWQYVKAGLPILVIKESEKQSYYSWFS